MDWHVRVKNCATGSQQRWKLLCTNSSCQRKNILDGYQVRLMSCGILPTSSPGVVAFPGFPGRFVLLPTSFVSLWMLLRIRGFCVFEYGNSAQHQPVSDLMFFFSILGPFQDKLHFQLSVTVCTCTTCQQSKLQQHNRFFFVGL